MVITVITQFRTKGVLPDSVTPLAVDNSIIQRGVTSDNRSRPLAFFPKTVCRVTSRRGASIDVLRSENKNAKCFTVFAELADTSLCNMQNLAQQMHSAPVYSHCCLYLATDYHGYSIAILLRKLDEYQLSNSVAVW